MLKHLLPIVIKEVKEFVKRYEAKRSISGLLGWGDDPKRNPKDSPWEGASDVGIPIDAFTIEGLLPTFLKVCYGAKPVAWVKGKGENAPRGWTGYIPVVKEEL